MPTGLKAPCTIDKGGDYFLLNDVEIESGTAFNILAGSVRLDLNGRTIRCSQGGNPINIGVKVEGPGNVLIQNGTIIGFRYGIHSDAPWTTVREVDFSGCRYIGAHLAGDCSRLVYCRADGIGGVTDEAYAIAVNVAGRDSAIEANEFLNIYRQPEASEHLVGEGCPIVVNSAAVGCVVRRNLIENRQTADATIGIFTGIGGNHVIEANLIIRHQTALMMHALSSVSRNLFWLPEPYAGSVAVCGLESAADRNVIVGYETGFLLYK